MGPPRGPATRRPRRAVAVMWTALLWPTVVPLYVTFLVAYSPPDCVAAPWCLCNARSDRPAARCHPKNMITAATTAMKS